MNEHDTITQQYRKKEISKAEFIRKHDTMHANEAYRNGLLSEEMYVFRIAQIEQRVAECEAPPSA